MNDSFLVANDLSPEYMSVREAYRKEGFEVAMDFKVLDKRPIMSADWAYKMDGWQESHKFVANTQDYAVYFASVNSVCVFARCYKDMGKFIDRFKDCLASYDEYSCHAKYYFVGSQGVSHNHISIDPGDFGNILPELYPNIDVELLLNDYQNSDETILFLYGPPGVGKTTFLKYVMQKSGMNAFGYIKDEETMRHSALWPRLADSENNMIIFDDLDFDMGNRDRDGGGFVSNLLSFSDGLFNKSTKIVITTNQRVQDIDDALLRPGRCFDVLHLEPLTQEQARSAWTGVLKMDNSSFGELFGSQNQVMQAELMSHYKRIQGQRRHRGYIRDGSSMRDRIERAGAGAVGFGGNR